VSNEFLLVVETAEFQGLGRRHPRGRAGSVTVSPMSKLSLDRVLQSQGFGTRKYCRALIEDGDVAIGDVVQDNYKTLVETDGLVLNVFDEEWVYREHVYIALH
jgi:16S rRNA pseudouridine516 synthase